MCVVTKTKSKSLFKIKYCNLLNPIERETSLLDVRYFIKVNIIWCVSVISQIIHNSR